MFIFRHKPGLTWREDLDLWTLDEDLLAQWNQMVIVVPHGFDTDLASIPRGLWNILPKEDDHLYPSIVHDYGYQYGFGPLNKEQIDLMFYEAMEACGVPAWKRWLMWTAVRMFGQAIWDKHHG